MSKSRGGGHESEWKLKEKTTKTMVEGGVIQKDMKESPDNLDNENSNREKAEE